MALTDLLPGILIGFGISSVVRHLLSNDPERRPLTKSFVHAAGAPPSPEA